MTTPLLDRRNVDFLLYTWLKAEALADRDTVDAVLDLSQKLAAEQFLTHFKRSDIEEPRLEAGEVHLCPAIGDALAQYAELGLHTIDLGAELRIRVDGAFLFAPVVAVDPVGHQFLEIGGVGAVLPPSLAKSSAQRVSSRRARRSLSTSSGTSTRKDSILACSCDLSRRAFGSSMDNV